MFANYKTIEKYKRRFILSGEGGAGFTIIELIISIFIVSIAIVGILSAFSVVIILTSDTADRLVATYLAQEGMEVVRNMRDTNWLNIDTCSGDSCSYTWTDGIDFCTQGCEADYTTGVGAPGSWPMTQWTGRYLYINTNGFYVYNQIGASKTKFQRKITITPVQDIGGDSGHIINVKTEVSWDANASILFPALQASSCGSSNCIAAEETLYDWYKHAQ